MRVSRLAPLPPTPALIYAGQLLLQKITEHVSDDENDKSKEAGPMCRQIKHVLFLPGNIDLFTMNRNLKTRCATGVFSGNSKLQTE